MLGIDPTEWAAYQLDYATWLLGSWVDGKMAERDKKGKPIHKLSDLLSNKAGQGGAFRSVANKPGIKKMKIPASGVW